MKTVNAKIRKEEEFRIKLPEGTVTIGPGTVPTSEGSVKRTIVSEMVSKLRQISKEGIFDSSTENYGTISPTTSK